MMRGDVQCPACPDPDTAFVLRDMGMKFTTDGDYQTDDAVTYRATRPVWEPVMLDHLRFEAERGDEEHRRVYGECMVALLAAGQTVEDQARNQVEAVTGMVRRQMDDILNRRGL